jgi:putative transposase
MSTQTDVVTDSADAGEVAVSEGLAEQLLAAAKAPGVSLTGPGGLLTGLTRQVLQTVLETEMIEHLGHVQGGTPGPGAGMSATGTRPRRCAPRSGR